MGREDCAVYATLFLFVLLFPPLFFSEVQVEEQAVPSKVCSRNVLFFNGFKFYKLCKIQNVASVLENSALLMNAF